MPPRTKAQADKAAATAPGLSNGTHKDPDDMTTEELREALTEAQRKAQAPRRYEEDPDLEVWDKLTAPFPQDWVERLPKALRKDDQDKGRCEQGSRYTADGHTCGGWHSRSVHLDYIGHAGITDRLNDVLGPNGWSFQPYTETDSGLPWMASGQPFMAKLTIVVGDVSVTKWDLAENHKTLQEAYGDALRRCAMRFGVGTYLWSKSEQALNKAQGIDPEPERQPERQPDRDDAPPSQEGPTMTAAQARLRGVLNELDAEQATTLQTWWGESGLPGLYDLSDEHVGTIEGHVRGMLTPDPQDAR